MRADGWEWGVAAVAQTRKHQMSGAFLLLMCVLSFTIDSQVAASASPDVLELRVDLDKRSVFDPKNGKPMAVVLADTNLSVPANYFDHASVPSISRQTAMFLRASLPNMDPMPNGMFARSSSDNDLQTRQVMIFVEDARLNPSLQSKFDALLKLTAPHEASMRYELEAHKSLTEGKRNPFRREVFAEIAKDVVQGFIECPIDGNAPSPRCNYQFVSGNFIVRFSFSKVYLPQWRALRALSTNLLSAFAEAADAKAPNLLGSVSTTITNPVDRQLVFDPQNGSPLDIDFADTRLSVPKQYFDPAAVPRERSPAAMLLQAFLPYMIPIRADTTVEYHTHLGQGRQVMILIHDARSATKTLDSYLEDILRLEAPHSTTSQYDIEAYKPIATPGKNDRRDEIFAERDGTNVIGVIRCKQDNVVPSPGCDYEFITGHFLVTATFGKGYLPQWLTLRSRVTELIAIFAEINRD